MDVDIFERQIKLVRTAIAKENTAKRASDDIHNDFVINIKHV